MADKQTKADGRPDAGTEDPSQESDLDALVKQFRDETGEDRSAAVLKALKPVVDYAKRQKAKDEQSEVEQAVENAYKFVASEGPLKGLNKTVVRGLLEAYGLENPGFQDAWANQRKDPKNWEKALGEGRDWMKAQYEDIVKAAGKSTLRADLEAAKAAVAGTSTDEPEGEKVDVSRLFSMSDSDFRKDLNEAIAKGAR